MSARQAEEKPARGPVPKARAAGSPQRTRRRSWPSEPPSGSTQRPAAATKRRQASRWSSATGALLPSGCRTPLTRVVEEKTDGEAAEDQENELSMIIQKMQECVHGMSRRRSQPVPQEAELGGQLSRIQLLGGQLKQKLEHIRQLSAVTPSESGMSVQSEESCELLSLDAPSRWHSAVLVEQSGEA